MVAANGLGRQAMSDRRDVVVASVTRQGHLVVRVHFDPVVISICIVMGKMTVLVHASRPDHVVHTVCTAQRSVLYEWLELGIF